MSIKKEEIYFRIAEGKLKTFPGLHELLKQARDHGWRIGVGSSGLMRKILFSLSQVGLDKSFDAIVSAEEVTRGKPAPDLFLEVARRIGVPPEVR